MKPPEKVYPLIYIGRRLSKDGKLWHAFFNPATKEECFWKAIRGCYIGATYESSGEPGKEKISKRPTRILDASRPTESQLEKWQAQEDVVSAQLAEKNAESKVRKTFTDRKYKTEIAALCRIVNHLNLFEREAFVRFVIYQARKQKK